MTEETQENKRGTMITITLNQIRKHGPCEDGWRKLLKHLGKTRAAARDAARAAWAAARAVQRDWLSAIVDNY